MQFFDLLFRLLATASLASAVPNLGVLGKYFVNNATGDRFQIVGVAYQPGGSSGYSATSGQDALTDKDACLRDAALMQMLGVNAIRVYNTNPDLNHDECASIFNAAGIFMFLDVNAPLPGDSIESSQPWASYYASYLNRTFAIVEAFKDYPNTAAFFAGNEVISDVTAGATVPPYMRAVTRDLQNYIAKHSTRSIPIGYSAADVRSILFDTWEYLQCDDTDNASTDGTGRVDFFALNSYSWCGNSSFTQSTYDQLVSGFSNSSVPIFFSEYGCIVPEPRIFSEVPEIYSDQMSGVFSGGIVYEFFQGSNDYGLVNVSADGSLYLMDDFYTLQGRYAALNFTAMQGVAPSGSSPSPPVCGSSLITTAGFCTNFSVPALPPGAEDIIQQGVSPLPSGQLVAIDNFTVTALVKDNNGNALSSLSVVSLSANQINQPGINTAAASVTVKSSATTTAAPTDTNMGTQTGTFAATTSSGPYKSAAVMTGHVQSGSTSQMVAAALLAGVMVWFLV
ncbi:beta-glucanosyltransferase gel2 [Coniella lustricola]|uniref:1,3-beta-glucanosyltransferase n=1 Tax=Coniella lustricola TaxID=2025994 RepID=A0A2T2ZWB5_9PEZI|nr:beta-glucanosyltransferase gel2 [Coniella lustricola]